ncbi:MAG: hypothetical protein ACLR56_15245 [Oscillospiraceae bacterium]
MLFRLSFGRKITLAKCAAVVLLAIGKISCEKQEAGVPQGRVGFLCGSVRSICRTDLYPRKAGITGTPSELGTAIRTCVVLVMAWAVLFITGKQHTVRKYLKTSWGLYAFRGCDGRFVAVLLYRPADGPAAAVAPSIN